MKWRSDDGTSTPSKHTACLDLPDCSHCLHNDTSGGRGWGVADTQMDYGERFRLTQRKEFCMLLQDSMQDFQFMDSPKFVVSLGFTSCTESTTEIGLFHF
jgi:hypothetical protein